MRTNVTRPAALSGLHQLSYVVRQVGQLNAGAKVLERLGSSGPGRRQERGGSFRIAHAQDQQGFWLSDCSLLPATQPPLEPHRVLLPFGETLAVGMVTWLDRLEELGPVPAVVAGASATPRRSLEAQVLELTTVAEGLRWWETADSVGILLEVP